MFCFSLFSVKNLFSFIAPSILYSRFWVFVISYCTTRWLGSPKPRKEKVMRTVFFSKCKETFVLPTSYSICHIEFTIIHNEHALQSQKGSYGVWTTKKYKLKKIVFLPFIWHGFSSCALEYSVIFNLRCFWMKNLQLWSIAQLKNNFLQQNVYLIIKIILFLSKVILSNIVIYVFLNK